MLANESRFCGWFLGAGFVVFLIGAVGWRYAFQGPVLADTLRSVGAENSRWLWIHAWILSYVSSAVLGLGVLRSGVLPASTGWVGLVGGTVFTIGFVVVRGGPFAPPIMALLYTLWLGIALLRKGG